MAQSREILGSSRLISRDSRSSRLISPVFSRFKRASTFLHVSFQNNETRMAKICSTASACSKISLWHQLGFTLSRRPLSLKLNKSWVKYHLGLTFAEIFCFEIYCFRIVGMCSREPCPTTELPNARSQNCNFFSSAERKLFSANVEIQVTKCLASLSTNLIHIVNKIQK